ncbi:MAG: hypothetical protein RIS64_4114 [Bacteroidota bacterium]
MRKIFLLLCLSMVYANLFAQNLPWLLPPSKTYKQVAPFSGGLSVVTKMVDKKERYFFLDKQMRLSEDSYLNAYPVSHGFSRVFDVHKSGLGVWWRYRSVNGNLFGEYEQSADFQNDLAAVQVDGKWGYINTDGEERIPCKYNGARSFENNRAAVLDGSHVYILNQFGSRTSVPYKIIHDYSEGLAAVWDKTLGNIGYINESYQVAIPIQKGRHYAANFSNGFAPISDTIPHLAFLNKQGEKVFWFKNGTVQNLNNGGDQADKNLYDLHPFAHGLAAVRQQGKWGYINEAGKMAIPYEYDVVTRFSEGFAAVKKAGKWLYINKLGEIIRTGDFIDAQPCSEGMAWVRTEQGWGVLAIIEKLSIIIESPFKKGAVHDKIKMNATIVSHRALQSAEWTLNDKTIQNKKFEKEVFSTRLSEGIALKSGKNVLKLTVRNENDLKTNEVTIYYEPTKTAIRYYGLMIANNDYQSEQWASLEGSAQHPTSPISDSDTLAKILSEQYQFSHIFTLRNANLEQMNAALADLTEHKDSTERILFFYAGHGDYDKVQKKAYLVPIDGQGVDRKTQLSASHFSNQVNTLQTKHFLAIIDACYGGSFILDNATDAEAKRANQELGNLKPTLTTKKWSQLNRGAGTGKKGSRDSIPQPTPDAEASPMPTARLKPQDLEPSEKIAARLVISSGHRAEVPNASDFIQVLLEKLHENTGSKLGVGTLFQQVKEPVMQMGEHLVPQAGILPNAGSNGGDFIFRKKI